MLTAITLRLGIFRIALRVFHSVKCTHRLCRTIWITLHWRFQESCLLLQYFSHRVPVSRLLRNSPWNVRGGKLGGCLLTCKISSCQILTARKTSRPDDSQIPLLITPATESKHTPSLCQSRVMLHLADMCQGTVPFVFYRYSESSTRINSIWEL